MTARLAENSLIANYPWGAFSFSPFSVESRMDFAKLFVGNVSVNLGCRDV